MSVNISFRKDREKWQVTYWHLGKRKRPLFDEKREADNFARQVRLGLTPETRDSITIAEASKQYFERVSGRKNSKSRINDRRYLNLHFHFMTVERGIEKLRTIELADVEAFRDWLPRQKEYDGKEMSMGPGTVNRCLRVLKHFFKRHVQWKSIPESPCLYLEFLEEVPTERKVMTVEQYQAMFEKLESWMQPVVYFSFLTGAPPSCIERLTWADVDLQARTFSLLRKKGARAQWKRIPMAMTEPTFALLVAIRNQWPVAEGEVFRDNRGCRIRADRITRKAGEALKAAGIKGVTLYGLRHALASDLTMAGTPTELVRQAMGHQSIATTQRYANKLHLTAISGALESVRGGSLVANGEK